MRITKKQIRRIIREEAKRLREDHIDTELDNLKKNVHDDIEHIRDLKDDIESDREEEERAKKDKKNESIKVTKSQLKLMIREAINEDKSGKGKCPDTGCIKKSGNDWRIISNKTGKLWPQKYKTRKSAESALDAYHASR